jgi:hypothetical protein
VVLYIAGFILTMGSLAYLQFCAQQPEMAKTLTFLIEHCQLLSIVSACDLNWSCASRQMFATFSIADFSISSTFGSSCALQLDYYRKIAFMSTSPLVLWLCGMLMVVLSRIVKKPHLFSLREEALQMAQVIITLTHSSLTRSAMGYFATESIFDGTDTPQEHLKADYRAQTSDPEYSQFLIVAVIMLVFVVLVPVTFSAGTWSCYFRLSLPPQTDPSPPQLRLVDQA